MALVALLNPDDPAFAWEHAMAHRTALGVMSPLTRFGILPYFIDPQRDLNQRASPWHQNHQQAHGDQALHLPTEYASRARGVANWAILSEYDLSRSDSKQWWAFQNHLEHYVGSNSILPPAPPPAPRWTYPFW